MKVFYGILCFLLLSSALLAQTFEEFLPPETLIYISGPAGAEFLQQFQTSALGQLLQEAEMQPLLSNIQLLLAPFLQRLNHQLFEFTGKNLNDLYTSFNGAFHLALIRLEGRVPEVLGCLNFKDQQVWNHLLEKLQMMGLVIEEITAQEEFKYQKIQLGPDEFFCCTWVGSQLFFSFHPKILRAVAQQKKSNPSLQEHPEFQEISTPIGTQQAFRFWLNTKVLFQHPIVTSSLGNNQALLTQLGILQWTSISLAGWLQEMDFKIAFQIGTDSQPPQGITKLLKMPAFPAKMLGRLPQSTTFISAAQFDTAELYLQVKSFVQALDPGIWKQAESYLKIAEKEMGNSFENVLKLAGNHYVQVGFKDTFGEQEVWLFYPINLQNWHTQVAQLSKNSMILSETPYQGKTIYSYRLKPGILEKGLANFKPFQILQSIKEVLAFPTCYYVDGDRVVGAHMPQILMDFMDEMEKPADALPPLVQQALNSGASSLSWTPVSEEGASGYYTLCEVVALFLPFLSLLTQEEFPISSFDFPPAETVLKYQRPSFSYAKTEKNLLWVSQISLVPSVPQLSGGTILVGASVSAAIAIPGLFRARISSSQTSVIGTLRTLSTAQNLFQYSTVKDRDLDGVGEYGFFTELSGTLPVPVGESQGSPAKPNFMSSVLGESSVQKGGIAEKSGYYFVLYLPSGSEAGPIRENGQAVPPVSSIGDMTYAEQNETNAQETRWCAFAWPVSAGKSGNKAFFINQAGEVVVTSNICIGTNDFYYSGLSRIPKPEDIFDQDGVGDIDASLLIGSPTSCGLIWNPTN